MSEILLCSEPAVFFQTEEANLSEALHFEKKILPYEQDFKYGLKEDQSTLVSVLAKDVFGQFIFKSLEQSGNDLSQCGLSSSLSSAVWFGTANEKPMLQTPLSAINQLTTGMINELDLYRFSHLHLSGNLLGRTQNLYENLLYLAARAKHVHLTISMDLIDLPDIDQISGLIDHVDWFVADHLDLAHELLSLGVRRIVVHGGQKGVNVYENGNEVYVPGYSEASLAEFSGALIHYYLQTGSLLMSVRQAIA